MKSFEEGSAKNILDLLDRALELSATSTERKTQHEHFSTMYEMLSKSTNNKIAKNLKQDTIEKSIYHKASKACKQGRGSEGLRFWSIYLDSISQLVHKKDFVEHYGEFKGIPYDAKRRGKVNSGSNDTDVKASVIAFQKYHDGKNLEEYLSDFEEATGFQDYVIELQGSRYHPKNIIREIRTDFDFLGHGASKWTNEFELLNKAIEKIKRYQGVSRFLIFDPRNAVGLEDHGDKSEDIQEQKKILNSLLVLKRLSVIHNRKGTEVQVRIYPELPKFRLAFINQHIVLVGHYNGHTRNSNESPIIVFNAAKEWSFFSAFRALFNENWERAENLDTHWDSLQELYELRGIDSSLKKI